MKSSRTVVNGFNISSPSLVCPCAENLWAVLSCTQTYLHAYRFSEYLILQTPMEDLRVLYSAHDCGRDCQNEQEMQIQVQYYRTVLTELEVQFLTALPTRR